VLYAKQSGAREPLAEEVKRRSNRSRPEDDSDGFTFYALEEISFLGRYFASRAP
jgi:hypothetical protein